MHWTQRAAMIWATTLAAACTGGVGDFNARPTDAGDVVTVDVVTPLDMPTVTDVTPGDERSNPPDVVVPPVDVVVVPDAPVMSMSCGTIPSAVAVALPPFDAATTARVRTLVAAGRARGNRAGVFAKIGDSITEAGGFLMDIGQDWFEQSTFGSRYACLWSTREFFRATAIGDDNSFTRASVSAMGGWTSDRPLEDPAPNALQRELTATRPAYAIIMLGTNDVDHPKMFQLRENLTRIAQTCEDFGTVPVLSTIPDRLDNPESAGRVPMANAIVRDLAASRHIPVIDYWAAMLPLPRHGIEEDGIHPSVYRDAGDAQAGVLSDAGLAFGYNMRNLTAMLMLERLHSLP